MCGDQRRDWAAAFRTGVAATTTLINATIHRRSRAQACASPLIYLFAYAS
jgi:hypothetical protein